MIGFGVNYTTGLAIHSGTHRQGMEQPLQVWVPSIGISGMMFYTGDRFPQWKGNLFVGGMAGAAAGAADARRSADRQPRRRWCRRRAASATSGRGRTAIIYLVTDDRDGKPTPVFRMEPVERAPVK